MRDNPDYYSQKKTLPQLKKTHPWYGEIYSQVLQDVVKRVKVTFDRFLKGDSSGKRSGKPRFKARNRYRTFTYPQMNAVSGILHAHTFPSLYISLETASYSFPALRIPMTKLGKLGERKDK